jgi:hypothetical protein
MSYTSSQVQQLAEQLEMLRNMATEAGLAAETNTEAAFDFVDETIRAAAAVAAIREIPPAKRLRVVEIREGRSPCFRLCVGEEAIRSDITPVELKQLHADIDGALYPGGEIPF